MSSLEGDKVSTLTPFGEVIFKAIAPKFGTDVLDTNISRALQKLIKIF